MMNEDFEWMWCWKWDTPGKWGKNIYIFKLKKREKILECGKQLLGINMMKEP